MRIYLLMCALGMLTSAADMLTRDVTGGAFFLFLLGFSTLFNAMFRKPKEDGVVGANCKESKCCPGELLVPMHSTNTKICTGCKIEQPWPLEPGQRRTHG